MPRDVIIAPSILAAHRGKMGSEVVRAEHAGADWLHLDIMDGHFVPNISFGVDMVEMVRNETQDIPLDVHLMISQPDRYAKDFIEAGADILTVHLEAEHNVKRTLGIIRDLGCKVGLAINPATLVDHALPLLDQVDLFLCMTVNPGFGGQKFMGDVMEKVAKAREYVIENNLDVDIEVDGGINMETSVTAVHAGANVLVAGTALYGHDDMSAAIAEMRKRGHETTAGG